MQYKKKEKAVRPKNKCQLLENIYEQTFFFKIWADTKEKNNM